MTMTSFATSPHQHSISYNRAISNMSGVSATSGTGDDEMAASSDQLFLVTSYSDFDKLAHGPRGTRAKHSLHVYRFHPADGSLVLMNVQGDPAAVINPAFSRYHPRLNVVYTCTEDIETNGRIFAYAVGPNGELTQLGDAVDAGGTSTCYITIDKSAKHLLCVNYWDSTLAVIPLCTKTGAMLGPIQNMYDPKEGQKMKAAGRCRGGVNHSCNDEGTIRMRQADPHSHALVLDPFVGTVAYVPDLGKDLIREFYYDRQAGKITMELNILPSGLCTGMPDGPRYFEFHPKYNVAYVVNELSSTVAVFEVDRGILEELAAASTASDPDIAAKFKGRSSLRLIQSIKTLPKAFPTQLNTCGRICVHSSGRYVLVSNRGHQSIAIFRVNTSKKNVHRRGELKAVGYFHTRGETPRHFQFDASGQYLLVANQDTDSVAVFNFNLSSGEIRYTGNEYRVPSPNFVCCCPLLREDANDVTYEDEDEAIVAVNLGREESKFTTDAALTADATSDDNHMVQVSNLSLVKETRPSSTTMMNSFLADTMMGGESTGDSTSADTSCSDQERAAPSTVTTSTELGAGNLETLEALRLELQQARLEIAALKQRVGSETTVE